jgi:predicted regulator of Ras-like GTPase activity (Roadblock/LC7/MglB family)
MPEQIGSTALEALVETRGVHGVYEVSLDGFLLDSIEANVADPEAVAAVSAVAANATERIGAGLGLGGLRRIFLEYKQGKLIIARCGEKILVVVGNRHLVFGDILLKIDAFAPPRAEA